MTPGVRRVHAGRVSADDDFQREIERLLAGGDGLQFLVQPVCALGALEPVGVEALARFSGFRRHPPDWWFAEAAACGLGRALEVLAVQRALSLLDALPSRLYMAVNVSPSTAVSADLAEALHGVDLERVVLELTEHEPLGDCDALRRALAPLRRRGVRVAVDDLGSGKSDVLCLAQFRPDIVKLDRCLVTGVDFDPRKQTLVNAVRSYSESIGATVVAEGIETSDQLQALVGLGVRYGQGYFLGRPAAAGPPSHVGARTLQTPPPSTRSTTRTASAREGK